MRTVVVLMALSWGRAFLDRELPAGAVLVAPDPAVKRHRDRHLAARVARLLTEGRDVVVEAPSRASRRLVIAAAADQGARVVGYWSRPSVPMPWALDERPEYSHLARRPRKADGFDMLYEVVNPDGEYECRELT